MNNPIITYSLRKLFSQSETELCALSQYSREQFNILNHYIQPLQDDLDGDQQNERHNALKKIIVEKFGKNKEQKQKLDILNQYHLNASHAFLLRKYPNLFDILFKLDANPIITHIFGENAPSESTLLEILGDYNIPEGVGKKVRNEISNLITQSLTQPVSLPQVIDKQFINFINTYKSSIRDIFKSTKDPNDPKIILLKQQYVPQQDAKSIIELKDGSLDPNNSLNDIQFGSTIDKSKILDIRLNNKNNPYDEYFTKIFLPTFKPQSTNKVYIYDLYIWGYYNLNQFNSIVASKKLNREQIIETMQQQAFEWMYNNLEVPPQNIKVYEKGKFPEKTNGKEGDDFLQIKNLNTSLDLVMESNTLNHCAGAYHQEAVENGEEEFYSIQDQNNTPKTTIVLKSDNKGYYVSEIRGPNNSRPDEKYMNFAGGWIHENGIRESDDSLFKTNFSKSKGDYETQSGIEDILYYKKIPQLKKLVDSKSITLENNPKAFWNYLFMFGLTSPSKCHSLIFNKIITENNEPILFNLLIYGNKQGVFKEDFDKTELEYYVLDKFEEYYYDKPDIDDSEADMNKQIDYEKLAFYDYIPIAYDQTHNFPEEGGDYLYKSLLKEKINYDYHDPDEDEYMQERREENQRDLEEDWDYDEFPEGPTIDYGDYELEQEWAREFEGYKDQYKDEWVENNFPKESFQFRNNVKLILDGIIRPGNPMFDFLFDKLKNKEPIHKYIKNWVLKGSSISKNDNYKKYFYDLANHWLLDSPRYENNEFNSKEFAALAVHTKAISRLDGMENLTAFLEKMSPDKVEWGYSEFELKNIIDDGVVSRLDFQTDKDAKINFITQMRDISPLQSFSKELVDDDIMQEMLELSSQEAEKKHQKYLEAEKNGEILSYKEKQKREMFYLSLSNALRIGTKDYIVRINEEKQKIDIPDSVVNIAKIGAEGLYPSEIITFGIHVPQLNESKKIALLNMARTKKYDEIVKSMPRDTTLLELQEIAPEEFNECVHALIDLIKNNKERDLYEILGYHSSGVDFLLQRTFPNHGLDDVIDLAIEKNKELEILQYNKLTPQDPRRKEILEKGLQQLYSKIDYDINNIYIFLKNKTILPQDGDIYINALSSPLRRGQLPNFIIDEIITIENKNLFQWIVDTPDFWNIIEYKNGYLLLKAILKMDESWEPLYSAIVKEYFIFDPTITYVLADIPIEYVTKLINEKKFGEKIISLQNGSGFKLIMNKLIDPKNQDLINKALYDALNNNTYDKNKTQAAFSLLSGNLNEYYGENIFQFLKTQLIPEDMTISQFNFIRKENIITPDDKIYHDFIIIMAKEQYWEDLIEILPPDQFVKLQQKYKPEAYNTTPTPPPQNNEEDQPNVAASIKNLYSYCSSIVDILEPSS